MFVDENLHHMPSVARSFKSFYVLHKNITVTLKLNPFL